MTAQVGERLILDGVGTGMAFCPPLPANHPRVKEVSMDEVRAGAGSSVVMSTACWRHYIGTWEVKEGRFYLVGMVGRYRLEGDEPLFADWFSGALRIPQGEMLKYVHMGFASVYERELHVTIKKGLVTETQVIENRGMGSIATS